MQSLIAFHSALSALGVRGGRRPRPEFSSLIAVAYHNLAVETAVQERVPDALAHMRTYKSLLQTMSKLSESWLQKADNTQWLIYKIQELWPMYSAKQPARLLAEYDKKAADSRAPGGGGSAEA